MSKFITGKFITLEGIEGVGKTSNRDYIRTLLEESGKQCVVTREPGGTPLGESLRELLLQHSDEQMSDDAELLMMFAARAEHIKKVIRPALDADQFVLCDRFTEATFAYQGGGRQLDISKISDLESWVQGDLRPDLTIILDAPVEVGRERAGKRSAPDRFELEKHDFFNKVRDTYLSRAKAQPDRYQVIDASPAIPQVQQSIQSILEKMV